MAKFAAILFSLFILQISSSCALGPQLKAPYSQSYLHKTIYVSKSFERWEVILIESAAHEWECATNGVVKYNIITNVSDVEMNKITDRDHSAVMVMVDSHYPMFIQYDVAQPDGYRTSALFTGNYDGVPAILVPKDRIESKNFQQIMVHEFGHLQGLSHNTDKKSIMHPIVGYGGKHVGYIDVEELCKLYGCDPSIYRSCQ